jgi:4a-hydroxytetrahydrobiopterin dehydratase
VDRRPLPETEIAAGLQRLSPDWHVEGVTLQRRVEFSSFLTAVEFVQQMAPEAERLAHHPDLFLSWRNVELTLSTHSENALTGLDFELATALDRIIRDLTT